MPILSKIEYPGKTLFVFVQILEHTFAETQMAAPTCALPSCGRSPRAGKDTCCLVHEQRLQAPPTPGTECAFLPCKLNETSYSGCCGPKHLKLSQEPMKCAFPPCQLVVRGGGCCGPAHRALFDHLSGLSGQ